MKKQLVLSLSLVLITIGVITISSCKKSSSNIAGSYSGSITDTLNLSSNSTDDTVVVTVSGNSVTFTDRATGTVINGTLGTATTTSGTTTTPFTVTNQPIKFGTTTYNYNSYSILGSGCAFSSVTGGSTTISSLSLILSDSSANNTSSFSTLDFTGLKY
jgi:hypothetical protein